MARFSTPGLVASSLLFLVACGSDDAGGSEATASASDVTGGTESSDGGSTESGTDTSGESSGGDGDSSTSGDGDSSTSGDGDSSTSGDGDSSTSGDGDSSTSGDGDSGTSGDGDSSTSGDGDSSTSGDGDSSTSGGDGDGGTTTGGDGDGDMSCFDCADNTDLIYVLSDDAELWSFDPANNQFAMVGALNCGSSTNFGTFSMSVSRAGIAWVMFQDDKLYKIDVNEQPLNCVDSGWTPTSGFELFGMGFVSNSLTDPCEKLYMHDWSGFGGFSEGMNAGTLGAMEPSDLSVQVLGSINYDGGELTGTGDGRLFAFAGTNPAKLVEYDKTNANEIATTALTGLNLTNAFAFAHYDGDFFFFTESDNSSTVSKVTYYDPDNPGVFTPVVPSAPIRIVGAGVSTCAPFPE